MSFFSNADLIDVDPLPWMKDKKFVLIKDMDELKTLVDEAIQAGHCSLDLETTGLDSRIIDNKTEDKIVGYCLSYDGETGYYVPVGHVNPSNDKPRKSNLSRLPVAEEIQRLCEDCVTIYHNALFDHEFLYGSAARIQIDDPDMFEDTLILDNLRDSTAFQHGLKYLSKELLKMEMIELKELFADSSNGMSYAKLDPTNDPVLWYAGSDAICTYLLWEILREHGEDQKQVYRIEKACIPAHRWMERNRPRVDLQYAKRFVDEVSALIEEVTVAIYGDLYDGLKVREGQDLYEELASKKNCEVSRIKKEFGPELIRELYDINSTQQLGHAMELLKKFNPSFSSVELERTEASEQVKTSEDAMERLEESYGDQFSFIKNIGRRRKLQKVLNTYAQNLYDNTDKRDSSLRMKFDHQGTDSGRFSGKGGRTDFGYSGINWQSAPGTKYAAKFPVKKIEERPNRHGDKDATLFPEFVDAWEGSFLKRVYDGHFIQDLEDSQEYCIRRTCEGCPFADSCKRTEPYKKKFLSLNSALRPAIVARRNSSIVAIDYSGVELRVAANITNESKWIEEFEEGDGDLHTLTARIVYGDKKINSLDPEGSKHKRLRGNAKAANFAVLYGGGGGAIANSTGIPYEEGKEILNKMLSGLPAFSRWKKETIRKAHQDEYIETFIGRKVRLDRINDAESWLKAKQERKAVNSVIQGTAGGDVLKYSMGAVYREMKKRGWLDRVRMFATIHDELVFDIDNDILEEAIDAVCERMTEFADKVNWRVPLEVDVELDKRWQPTYDWDKMHNVENGLAQTPFPEYLKDSIRLEPGMWYKKEGDKMVWDGDTFVTKETYLSKAPAPALSEANDQEEEKEEEAQEEGKILPEKNEEGQSSVKSQLPEYEYKVKVNLTQLNASSYMIRLRRVLNAMSSMIRDRRTEATHQLIVKTMQGDKLLPEDKSHLINPTVFEILAYYEGL